MQQQVAQTTGHQFRSRNSWAAIFWCLTLFQAYKERKAIELKLTGIALNRSKNHIGETTTDKGVQVGSISLIELGVPVIKPNYLVLPPTDAAPQFLLKLTPFIKMLKLSMSEATTICLSSSYM